MENHKETLDLNYTLDEMVLTDIYRTFHWTTEYSFFSSAHGTFSRINNMLWHKANHNTFKKTEIIPNIFSDHSGMKLEINYKKKTGKFLNMWLLNNMLLNNQWVKGEIKREIKKKKKNLEKTEFGNTTQQKLVRTAKTVLKGSL